MKFNWRKWNRIIHRDLGYFFFGMTIIYGVSGIAINHLQDWDPNFIITTQEINIGNSIDKESIDKNSIKDILSEYNESDNYKKYYFPNESTVKIFLKKGTAEINLDTGKGIIETVRRRPFINQVNYLHYNPIKYWTWFSDFYAVSLVLIAISGLFIIKGKKGITGRGAWLTTIGIIIPIIYLIFLL